MKLFALCLMMSKSPWVGNNPKMQGQNSNWVQVLLLWSKLQTSCKHGDEQKKRKVGMKLLSAPKTGCQWKEVCYSVFPGSGLLFLPL
jgi:hypothetical protein